MTPYPLSPRTLELACLARYLAAHGPVPVRELEDHFGRQQGTLYSTLAHPWFERSDHRVRLSAAGRLELNLAEKTMSESISKSAALLAVLDGQTVEDLADLDREIQAIEGRLASLRTLRKVVAARVGEQPAAAAPASNGHARGGRRTEAGPLDADRGGGQRQQRREAAARHLLANGPTRRIDLCRLLDIPSGSSTAIFSHPWFEMDGAHLSLTTAGHQAAKGATED